MEYKERKINNHLILKTYYIKQDKLIYIVKDEKEIAEVIPSKNLKDDFCELFITTINNGGNDATK